MSQLPKPTQKLRTIREWEVELPLVGTPEWRELVALLFNRPDMREEFFTRERVVSTLVAECEMSGQYEYPRTRVYDPESGQVRLHVLATARPLPASASPVYDPKHYQSVLDAIN